MIEELRREREKDIKMTILLPKLFEPDMSTWVSNAEQEHKLQEDVLDADFPKWRDATYDDTDMDKIVPVIPGELLSVHKLDLS